MESNKSNAFDYDPELVLEDHENFFAFVCPEWDDDKGGDEPWNEDELGDDDESGSDSFELAGGSVEELLKSSRDLLALWKLKYPEIDHAHAMIVQPLVNIVEDYRVYEDKVERIDWPNLAN
jgi:hypothetical protein